jgi:hypothetical protein
MKRLAFALALTIAAAQPASAYFLTCGAVRAAVLLGTDETIAIVSGHAFGVSDMLATLLCFAGDRRCQCLSNMGDRAGQYGSAVGEAVNPCPANDSAVGRIFNAALEVCG